MSVSQDTINGMREFTDALEAGAVDEFLRVFRKIREQGIVGSNVSRSINYGGKTFKISVLQRRNMHAANAARKARKGE